MAKWMSISVIRGLERRRRLSKLISTVKLPVAEMTKRTL